MAKTTMQTSNFDAGSDKVKDARAQFYANATAINSVVTAGESDGVIKTTSGDGTHGNVMLGSAVEETWDNTNLTVVQFGNNASLSADKTAGAGKAINVSQNAYYDTNDSRWEYQDTDEATIYTQVNGKHLFKSAVSGTADTAITWIENLSISDTEVVVNEGAGATSFRVEGSSDPYLLYATTNKVAVGTSTVGQLFTVDGNIQCNGNIWFDAFGSQLLQNSTAFNFFSNGKDIGLLTVGTNHLTFTTNSVERIRVSSGGNLLIGTTTDDGTNKLQVNGDVSFTNNGSGIADLLINNNDGVTASSGSGVALVESIGTGKYGTLQYLNTSFASSGVQVPSSIALSSNTGAIGGISISTLASAPIRFATNGLTNERMRISSGGNILIGTTTDNSSGIVQTAGHIVPATDSSYNLGATSTYRWSNIYLINSPTVESDERVKQDIIDSDLGLEFVKQVRPVQYKLKKDDKKELRYGLIAQEVKELLGESWQKYNILGYDEENDRYSIRYEQLIGITLQAIKELNAKVEEQEVKHQNLLERIEALENR